MSQSFYVFIALLMCFSLQGDVIENKTIDNQDLKERKWEAFKIKNRVARFNAKQKIKKQLSNGDEERYRDLRGSYGKALLHNSNHLINHQSFRSFLHALTTHKSADFDQIILGNGSVPPGYSKVLLRNPQACFAFSLNSADAWINTIPPAPRFASDETGGEMVELYWTVLCRDIPFNYFETSSTVAAAVNDLNTLTDFKGPKIDGKVTPHTFLRGNLSGDLIGPYISQFFYQTIPFGPITIPPAFPVAAPGIENDFLTHLDDWSTVINGGVTERSIIPGGTHFMRTPRDLAQYLYSDFSGQTSMNAAMILWSYGSAAWDVNNPYLNNSTQASSISYGQAYLLSLIQIACEESVKAAWFIKWQVNRRQRPEEFGFFVNAQKGGGDYDISPQLMDSPVLPRIFSIYGSYLLPSAYPEGCPAHPSYPAGHAVSVGAGVTILKAFFNEAFEIPNPLMPDLTNTSLVSYSGAPLLVGNELNKLASNVALGRDIAGVHYRSDGYYGLLLGEKIAISILNQYGFLFNENFKGYSLTTFNGETITVGSKKK